MFSLSVARQAVGQYQSQALVQPLEAAYRKLSWRLADNARAHLHENTFSFRPFAPEAIDDGTLSTLQQGARGCAEPASRRSRREPCLRIPTGFRPKAQGRPSHEAYPG